MLSSMWRTGARRFMLRLPKRSMDLIAIENFSNEVLTFRIKDGYVMISFEIDETGSEREDGDGWMEVLISLSFLCALRVFAVQELGISMTHLRDPTFACLT
jgi:hypothetical protein